MGTGLEEVDRSRGQTVEDKVEDSHIVVGSREEGRVIPVDLEVLEAEEGLADQGGTNSRSLSVSK